MSAQFNRIETERGGATVIDAKVGKKPFIEIPEHIYDSLGLNEGQSIQIKIIPAKKQVSTEEKLKILEQMRGIWADDEKIAEAFAYLDGKWEEWDKEYLSKRA